MKPWRLAKTAPKNKVVLAGWGGEGTCFPAIWRDDGIWEVSVRGGHPEARCGMWFEVQPTHWMPLPKVPTVSDKKSGKRK